MSFLSSLRDSPAPAAAVNIASDRVSAATIERRGGQPALAAHAFEPLPPGTLVPAFTAHNVVDRPAVAGALARVLDRIGRPRRIALAIPDVVAKVSLLKFATVPSRAQDLDQLVRWQMRKTAPFAIEDAQVSYVPALAGSDGQEFVVSLAKRSVVAEYEALCADAGAHAGIVDLATFSVINAVLAAGTPPPGDWLLVNIAAESTSIALLRGSHLIFFRNRAIDTDGTLADLVHQTAMYYEDRLHGGGFSRALISGSDLLAVGELRHTLEERLRTTVDTVDPRAAASLTDRIAAAPALLDTLAPLVGLLLRDHEAVRA